MKITKIECIPVPLPYKKPMKIGKHTSPAANSIVVKIHTDEGITGIGESGHAVGHRQAFREPELSMGRKARYHTGMRWMNETNGA